MDVLHELSHLNSNGLMGSFNYYPHFTQQETKVEDIARISFIRFIA